MKTNVFSFLAILCAFVFASCSSPDPAAQAAPVVTEITVTVDGETTKYAGAQVSAHYDAAIDLFAVEGGRGTSTYSVFFINEAKARFGQGVNVGVASEIPFLIEYTSAEGRVVRYDTEPDDNVILTATITRLDWQNQEAVFSGTGIAEQRPRDGEVLSNPRRVPVSFTVSVKGFASPQ